MPRRRSTDLPLSFRCGASIYLITPGEILWVAAEGNYSRVHCADRSVLVREVIGSIARRLEGLPFCRIHRSCVVNVEMIFEMRRVARRRYLVVLRNGRELPVGGEYRMILEEQLTKW